MYKYYLPFLLIFIFLAGCKENERGIPVSKEDTAPPPVTDVRVTNLPGGAKISYNLPKSGDLLYVLASYSARQGVEQEKKSSYYNNSLTIEGFPNTKEYQVKLYAVSRGGKKSDPVTVTIKPLTPPVWKVFQSLQLAPTFGGISVKFQDSSEASVVITVLAMDSTGVLSLADQFYTKRMADVVASRGFDTTKRKFGVFVRDRWDNYSDTLFGTFKPLAEIELDKTRFQEVHLQGDDWQAHGGQKTVSKLWDNQIVFGENNGMFSSETGYGFPQAFAFDLGVQASLSRFKYYPRCDGKYAYTNQPRLFEIWGSNNPSSDGSWDSWTKLLDCEMIKPSGSPPGTVTDEDISYCQAGIEFEFPPDTPPVRYIRFKTISVWSGSNISVLELTFFGNVQ
jgi:hypothetical protein